ncbi:zinc finger protein 576-like [Cuculus canorus]|uniref:zinc finger protein 576-like n=1 Tax=Cuculus canorus TaxID=55661 RepID=UPI0023AABC26|nr:zinc finger protein 576-like [Cuculus canorus]
MSQPPPPEPPRPPEPEGGGGGGPAEPRADTAAYRPGSTQCGRCLITFPDAAFAARHAKRQHPRDFAAAALRGALFVCFVCARPFASSPALLRHQRAHGPPPARAPPAPPPFACTECGRGFAREGALHGHYMRHARGELRGRGRGGGA